MRRRDFFLTAAMLAPGMRHDMARQSAKTKRIAAVNPSMKVADMRTDPNFVFGLEELKTPSLS
jgi:hypothetical protein